MLPKKLTPFLIGVILVLSLSLGFGVPLVVAIPAGALVISLILTRPKIGSTLVMQFLLFGFWMFLNNASYTTALWWLEKLIQTATESETPFGGFLGWIFRGRRTWGGD